MCVCVYKRANSVYFEQWDEAEGVRVVSSGPRCCFQMPRPVLKKEIVEEGLWVVAISIGLCMRTYNGCHYSPVSMQNHVRGVRENGIRMNRGKTR